MNRVQSVEELLAKDPRFHARVEIGKTRRKNSAVLGLSYSAAYPTFQPLQENGLEIVAECTNVLQHDYARTLLKRCHDPIDGQVAAYDRKGVVVRVGTSFVNGTCDTPACGKCLRGDEHGNIRAGCEMNLMLQRVVSDIPLNGGGNWCFGTSET